MDITSLIINVAILFIMMVPGVLLKKCKMCPDGFGKGIANLVLYIAQPVLIVYAYLDCEAKFTDIWADVVAVLVISLIAHAIFAAVAIPVFKKAPAGRDRMLKFATIFSNAAFMGIPLIQSIFSTRPEMAIYASIYNVSFNLFLWTLGVVLCTRNNGEDLDGDGDSDIVDLSIRAKSSISFSKVLFHPVTLASVIGIIFLVVGVKNSALREMGLDIIPDANSGQKYGVQASLDHNPLKGTVNALVLTHSAGLRKINTNDQVDFIIMDRVELNENNTMVYFTLYVMEDRSVPISVSSDWKLTVGKKKYGLTSIHGLPVDKGYIRDAGFTTNTFRAEFPAVKRKFKKGTIQGTVCGEKVEFEVKAGVWAWQMTKQKLARVVLK